MSLNIQGSGRLIYRHSSKDVTTKRTLLATRKLNTFHKTKQQLILWDGLTVKNVKQIISSSRLSYAAADKIPGSPNRMDSGPCCRGPVCQDKVNFADFMGPPLYQQGGPSINPAAHKVPAIFAQ